MSKIRSNPFFPSEVGALSNALGVYWRELAASVNKHEQGITAVSAPVSSSSSGSPGQIAYDATHIYVCVATDTWVRATLATWP